MNSTSAGSAPADSTPAGGAIGSAPADGFAGSNSPAASSPPLVTAERPGTPSSPVLFPQADGRLAADPGAGGTMPLNPADGLTRDGQPYRPVVFTANNLWLVATGGSTQFALAVDAGGTVGAASQLRISYDLTGDGSWDRTETFHYFATDPEPGWESYTEATGLQNEQGGPVGELTGGTVMVEIWSALGDAGSILDLAGSSVTLPLG